MTKPTDNGLTILVIPDSHARPGVDNDRFTLLGKMICEVKPDVVVNIGDMFDLPSLSSYDKGKRSYEGRRYKDDIACGIDAQRRIFDEIDNYNRPRRGKSVLDIEWHYALGNHEARINRAIEDDPGQLEGVISIDDLTNNGEFPWEIHPFLEPFFIGGVGFSHYWSSGVMGRAISGVSPAAAILSKQFHSCIQGHTHTLDVASRCRADGVRLGAIVCGCYFTHKEAWAGPQVNALWEPGILVLRGVLNGEYGFEWWPMRRIESQFG